MRVLVVGGGVSGLTAAYHLHRDGADVTLLEASQRPGGRIGSVDVGGIAMETGPDSILARKPAAVDLCRELGLPLVSLEHVSRLDLYVDGADEVTPDHTLLKGRGYDLVKEKLLAKASDKKKDA